MFVNSDKSLFSLYLIDQSSCKMGLVITCVVRILHDDWSIRLGENRPDGALKHLAVMLHLTFSEKMEAVALIVTMGLIITSCC